jgi:peptide/nickel transport system permease protein
MNARGMLGELWNSATGKIGLLLLVALCAAAAIVAVVYPADFGPTRWSNPALWADNPRSAPPAWTNILVREKRVEHRIARFSEPTRFSPLPGAVEMHFELGLDFHAGRPPTFLSFSLSGVEFQTVPPVVTVRMRRPDGGVITLHREAIRGPRSGESPPFLRNTDQPLRVVLGPEQRAVDELVALFESRYGTAVERGRIGSHFEGALFGEPGGADGFPVLQGRYVIDVELLAGQKEDRAGLAQIVVGGSVYGVMGTDSLGRDLIQGLLYGLPIALLIGIATSVASTLLGMGLGMVSGYAGGKTDVVIQRAADVVANVPVLPLLIFLVFIGGSRLWLILMVLVAFSWPGLTIMIRAMVLQLRSGQEVEAARVLGASSLRIILRHIMPHTASYILSQLVFSAPSAILAEAGLSFLGLGDPSIPTWGQILETGFRTGAVYLGYWWWVIPPGLAIVITAVTFMFIALGLEPLVDPRLRGRRAWS